MKIYKYLAAISMLCALLATTIAQAANDSPAGTWVTTSDKTGDHAAIIRIFEQNGQFSGRIIKIFPGNGRQPTGRCEKCPAPFTNKPVLGLTTLWGFSSDGNGSWNNGQILDPQEGKIYRASITLSDDGKQLKLRGYWGPFWRTQTWDRVK